MDASLDRKLLVFDLNGLFCDSFRSGDRRRRPGDRAPNGKAGRKVLYARPCCREFLKFCFDNFDVGVWSSAQKQNVDIMLNLLFGDLKHKLLFVWYQSKCTNTGYKVPGCVGKPLFLKELSKLWNAEKPNVPWEKGRYGPTNTLLIDDSPYKALRNPPYTAIFPAPYNASFDILDNELGAEGTLRLYLKGLLAASDVQKYVKDHPFGQEAISNDHEHWHIFRRIATNVQNTNDIAVIRSKDTVLDVAAADENNPASKYRKINSNGTKEVTDIPVRNEGNVTKPHVEVNGNIGQPSVDINVNTRDQHVENSISHSKKRKKLGFFSTNVQNTNGIAVIRSKDTVLDVAAADENNPASKYRKINSNGTKEVTDIPVRNEGNVTKPHVEVNGHIGQPSVDINVNTRDQHVENSISHSKKRKKLGFSEGFLPSGFFLRSLRRAYRKRQRSRRC